LSAFTKQLLEVIVPVLDRGGFERWTPQGQNGGGTFYFRRRVGPRRDLFEVQLDKYGRRACFVNLASLESEQVETMFEGLVSADAVTTAHLSHRCRLRGNSMFGAFKPSLWERFFSSSDFGRKIAGRIVSCFDVADAWFTQRRSSPRLRQYRL
jgi:hypothetical protein